MAPPLLSPTSTSLLFYLHHSWSSPTIATSPSLPPSLFFPLTTMTLPSLSGTRKPLPPSPRLSAGVFTPFSTSLPRPYHRPPPFYGPPMSQVGGGARGPQCVLSQIPPTHVPTGGKTIRPYPPRPHNRPKQRVSFRRAYRPYPQRRTQRSRLIASSDATSG